MADEQEIFQILKAFVDYHEEKGRPVSGQEVMTFFAKTTGSTISLQKVNYHLHALDRSGDLTAKIIFDEEGHPSMVQHVEPTSQGLQKIKSTAPEVELSSAVKKRNIFTKPVFWICSVLVFLGLGVIVSFTDYRFSVGIASQLYPEIQGNLLKIEKTLANMRKHKVDEVDFVDKAYTKHYQPFGLSKLDKAIGNFYNSARMYDKYDQNSLVAMKNQGEEASNLLEDTFNLKAYGGEEGIGSIVSQDTTVAGVNIVGYAKYSGMKTAEFFSNRKSL